MSRLLKLKSWLTLDEAAEHLKVVFDEPVTRADVLRFGLDGHLKLSVNFVNHARVNPGQVVAISNAKLLILPRCLHDPPSWWGNPWTPPDDCRAAQDEWLGSLTPAQADELVVAVRGEQISDSGVVQFEPVVTTLEGVWDLSMLGAERLDVEHALQ